MLQLMQAGQQRAFAAIYNRYWQTMLDYACRRLNLQEDAEEIVQDIFVSLYQRRHEVDVHTSLRAYLYTSVRYKVYSKYREYLQKKQTILIPNLEDVDYPVPELDIYGYKELEGRVNDVIQKLPEKCREAFLLSRNEQLSNREIAERMGISVNTVEKHIGKALQVLKSNLKEDALLVSIVLMTTCS